MFISSLLLVSKSLTETSHGVGWENIVSNISDGNIYDVVEDQIGIAIITTGSSCT